MSTKRELQDEADVRVLVRVLKERGVTVRREKLSRGREFRVKSAPAQFFGENLLFVDRSLPSQQQLSVIMDFVVDRKIALAAEELEKLNPRNRAMLKGMVFDEVNLDEMSTAEPILDPSPGELSTAA